MTSIVSQCFLCKHYRKDLNCEAFPEKDIPSEILTNTVRHSAVVDGQEGAFVFEPLPEFKDAV